MGSFSSRRLVDGQSVSTITQVLLRTAIYADDCARSFSTCNTLCDEDYFVSRKQSIAHEDVFKISTYGCNEIRRLTVLSFTGIGTARAALWLVPAIHLL